MDHEPDQSDEVAGFGPAKSRLRLRHLARPIGIPAAQASRTGVRQTAPNALLVAAAAIIIALTITVITQAAELSGRPARIPATSPIHWGTDGAIASFPLKGTRGAILETQYLRVGHEARLAWITLAAAGLPRGRDYAASVGDCRRGRAHTLTGYMALPDNRTGIWLASWPEVPSAPDAIRWITVTRAGQARPLGGIRGNFVFRGRLISVPPGDPVCP